MAKFVMRNRNVYEGNKGYYADRFPLGIASEEGHLEAINEILGIIAQARNLTAVVEQVTAYAREHPVIKDETSGSNCKNAGIHGICQEFLDFTRGDRF